MLNHCPANIQEQVQSLEGLAVLPEVVTRVLDVVQDESRTALDLAQEIEMDPDLAGKVLRLINSPCYGARGVTTVPDAVILLGFDEIERIALAVSIVGIFGQDRPGVKALRLLWRHSLACAVAAGVIEQRNRDRRPDLRCAHLAGLLHDIGKAVIALYFPEEQARIDRLMVTTGMSLFDAEREALDGVTHCEIGGWLAERWDMPEGVVRAVALHHAPDEACEAEPLVHATHVANCVVKQLGIATTQGFPDEVWHPDSCKLVDLDGRLMDQIAFSLERSHCLLTAVANGAMHSPSHVV